MLRLLDMPLMVGSRSSVIKIGRRPGRRRTLHQWRLLPAKWMPYLILQCRLIILHGIFGLIWLWSGLGFSRRRDLARAFVCPNTEHPHDTPPLKRPEMTVLERHVAFFDWDNDGVIYPWDIYKRIALAWFQYDYGICFLHFVRYHLCRFIYRHRKVFSNQGVAWMWKHQLLWCQEEVTNTEAYPPISHVFVFYCPLSIQNCTCMFEVLFIC